MERPIYLLSEAFKIVNPQSLIGCIIEIWLYEVGSHHESADSPSEEEGRMVLRCEVDEIRLDQNPPFTTKGWIQFTHVSNAWHDHAPLDRMLYMSEVASMTGIHLQGDLIRNICPALNVHTVFFYPGDTIPDKPIKPMTFKQLEELLLGKKESQPPDEVDTPS